MKVSLKWLSEYVEIPADLKAFCDCLDLTGTGVEGVEIAGATYDKVVVGQIVEKKAHPDSDHMWVCQVSVGENNLGKDGKPNRSRSYAVRRTSTKATRSPWRWWAPSSAISRSRNPSCVAW